MKLSLPVMKTKALMLSRYTTIVLLAMLVFISCKKTIDNNAVTGPGPDPVPVPPAGSPVAAGVSDGSPETSKTIGIAGGSIESYDGMLRVDVPAGALEKDETFSIRRITNTNRDKKDSAYRIQPHKLSFKKKVKITMSYSATPNPEALAISYQNEKGIWMAPSGFVLDKTAKTISIETNHFSDWSIFSFLYLTPEQKMIDPGTSLPLEVSLLDELLAPLGDNEWPVGLPAKNIGQYIRKWALEGPGELNVQGEKVWYHAPENVTGPTEAVVRVEIDMGKRLVILYCYITILNSGITIQIPGKPDHLIQGYANFLADDIVVINGGDQNSGQNQVVLTWTGGKGNYSWADGRTQFLYTPEGNEMYTYFFRVDNEDIPSGGSLTVTDLGRDDGFVKGHFIIDPAGYGQIGQPAYRFGTIKGSFKIPKKKK